MICFLVFFFSYYDIFNNFRYSNKMHLNKYWSATLEVIYMEVI